MPTSKQIKKIERREWLNKDNSQARVLLTLRSYEGSFECSLDLSDCTRTVYMDFSIWGNDWNPTKKDFLDAKKSYQERINKVKILQKQLTDIETGLHEWWKQYEEVSFDKLAAKGKERKAKKGIFNGDNDLLKALEYNEE